MTNDQFQAFTKQVVDGFTKGQGNSRAKMSIFSSTDGVEWITWRANAVLTNEINGWEELRFKQEIKRAMEGEAARAVADIDITVVGQSPTQLLDAFQARFLPREASKLARAQFAVATMISSESLLKWHSRLRDLFTLAYPTLEVEDSTVLIDRFIMGIIDHRIKEHVLDANPDTYATALSEAQAKLATASLLSDRAQATGFGINALNTPGRTRPNQGSDTQNSNTGCWYCNDPNHIRRDCKSYREGRKYFQELFSRERNGRRPYDNKRGRGGYNNNRGKPYNNTMAQERTEEEPAEN